MTIAQPVTTRAIRRRGGLALELTVARSRGDLRSSGRSSEEASEDTARRASLADVLSHGRGGGGGDGMFFSSDDADQDGGQQLVSHLSIYC